MNDNYETSIEDVLTEFPTLHWNEERKSLKGSLEINYVYNDERIIDSFQIEIVIPINFEKTLPMIYSKDGKVPKKFNHIYKDDSLCLATKADQLCFFANDYSLIDWIKYYVIPYFFAVDYYKKYKIYVFGQREHGDAGITSFYEEELEVKSHENVLIMLNYILNKTYRGHSSCPCGSGKKIRNCHKDIIIKWKQDKYCDILRNDFILLSGGKENV